MKLRYFKMKKITGFISIIFAFIFVFVLASCSSTSGVEVEKSVSCTTTSITFNLTFAENSNLSENKAVPHIKLYAYDEAQDDKVGEYLSQDNTCKFSGSVYTSSTVTFTSLTKDTKYAFRFYVTFNQAEELIDTWICSTASGNAKEITTPEEFLMMQDDPAGSYTLMNDLDFKDTEVKELFNTTGTAFKGVFDGNGHTIKNFKFSSSTFGLFTYTDGAVIKNLNLLGFDSEYIASHQEDFDNGNIYNANFSSGLKTSNLGILVGTATDTEVVDVTIDNVSLKIKGNSNVDINVGGVVGSAVNSSFTNVHATKVSIEYTDLRFNVCTGLFAGSISGEAKKTDNGTYTAKNTSVEGTLTGTLHYYSTGGYAYVGGYAGDLGSSGLVSDSYTVADIKLYRNASEGDVNKFALAVGGFVGTNLNGSMFVKGCVAAADILVKAGAEATSNEDAATKALSNKLVYIAGFVGAVNKYVNTISDSCYVKKAEGITVYALAEKTDDENNTKPLYVLDNVCATTYAADKLSNVACANDTAFDTSVFTDEVKAVVTEYLA